jgi:hypothetical protein
MTLSQPLAKTLGRRKHKNALPSLGLVLEVPPYFVALQRYLREVLLVHLPHVLQLLDGPLCHEAINSHLLLLVEPMCSVLCLQVVRRIPVMQR